MQKTLSTTIWPLDLQKKIARITIAVGGYVKKKIAKNPIITAINGFLFKGQARHGLARGGPHRAHARATLAHARLSRR